MTGRSKTTTFDVKKKATTRTRLLQLNNPTSTCRFHFNTAKQFKRRPSSSRESGNCASDADRGRSPSSKRTIGYFHVPDARATSFTRKVRINGRSLSSIETESRAQSQRADAAHVRPPCTSQWPYVNKRSTTQRAQYRLNVKETPLSHAEISLLFTECVEIRRTRETRSHA